MAGAYEVISEQVKALAENQADHHSRVYKELEALRLSNLSLHNLVARIDERQSALANKLEVWQCDADARLDKHSERIDKHAAEATARVDEQAKRVDDLEHQGAIARAWQAGGVAVGAAILGAVLWLITKLPAQAWDALKGDR